jgi:hypothetical protein
MNLAWRFSAVTYLRDRGRDAPASRPVPPHGPGPTPGRQGAGPRFAAAPGDWRDEPGSRTLFRRRLSLPAVRSGVDVRAPVLFMLGTADGLRSMCRAKWPPARKGHWPKKAVGAGQGDHAPAKAAHCNDRTKVGQNRCFTGPVSTNTTTGSRTGPGKGRRGRSGSVEPDKKRQDAVAQRITLRSVLYRPDRRRHPGCAVLAVLPRAAQG